MEQNPHQSNLIFAKVTPLGVTSFKRIRDINTNISSVIPRKIYKHVKNKVYIT